MTEDEERLVKEVVDHKYKSCVEHRSDIKFDENTKRWKDYYEGTSDETKRRKAKGKSAVMPPWAGTSVDHLLARFIVSMFLRKPYFGVYPLQETTEGIIAAEIAQDLLEFQMHRRSPFNNMVRFTQSVLANGFGALRTGWDFEKDDVTLTNKNIKRVYYPPYTEDITDPDWIIFEGWQFFDDMVEECSAFEERYDEKLYQNLEEVPGLAGSHLEEMVVKYAGTGKRKPIHILEYWDLKKKVVIAGKKVLILKTKNPLDPPFIPVILASDIPKLEGIMGTGEIEAIEDYIRQIATITNQRNDNVIQSLIPAWLQNSGIEILNEEELVDLAPGVRIMVRAPLNVPLETVLTPFIPPNITEHSYMEVGGYERNIQDRRGLYPYVRGEAPKQRETATGIQSLQAAGSMVARFILMFMLRTSFIAIPEQIIGWDRAYIKDRTILAISKSGAIGMPVFRKVTSKTLEAELFFDEKVSAIDPEALQESKRAQLLQVLQVVAPFQQTLPQLDFAKLIKKVLGTYDVPGLESVVGAAPAGGVEVASPKMIAQQALAKRVPELSGLVAGGALGRQRGGR